MAGARRDLHSNRGRGLLPVFAAQRSWMGEQPPARYRHRRRDGWGDDAERLGSDLARTEKNYQVDGRQRGQRHTDARQSKIPGSAGISHFPRELCAVIPHAVPDGGRKSLSDVWEVEERLPQGTEVAQRNTG